MLAMSYRQQQKAAYPDRQPLNTGSAIAVYSDILRRCISNC